MADTKNFAEDSQPGSEEQPPASVAGKKASVTKSSNDPLQRFSGNGVSFRAKLFGTADVNEPRGDALCQTAMQMLKAAVRNTGEHKQKVILRVSMTGITLVDAASMLKLHEHPVSSISFISKDSTDNRAFGYVVSDVKEGKHVFFGIKTEKAAEQVVFTLRDLFQLVFDLKKKEADMKGKPAVTESAPAQPATSTATVTAPSAQSAAAPAVTTPTSSGEPAVSPAPTQSSAQPTVQSPQPALGEEVKADKAEVKREDSASHLLDLLSDLSMPEDTAASTIKAVNDAAWTSTTVPQKNDPFAVNVQGMYNQNAYGQPQMGMQQQQPQAAAFQQQPFAPQPFQQPQPFAPQQNSPFAQPAANQFQSSPFAQPANQFNPSQPFGQPQQNQFAPPTASPFPASAGMFASQQAAPSPFSTQQTAAASDPFNTSPFMTQAQSQPAASSTNPFGGSVLQPESLAPQPAPRTSVTKAPDLFSDLNPIHSNGQPRPSFNEITNPPKPKLNELSGPAQPVINNSAPSPSSVDFWLAKPANSMPSAGQPVAQVNRPALSQPVGLIAPPPVHRRNVQGAASVARPR